MSVLRKLMKILMKLLVILLLLIALVFVYAVGLAAYKSHESMKLAEAFCEPIQPSQPIETVLASAKAQSMRDSAATATDPNVTHEFSASGFMYSYSACEVTVLAGKVQTKTVRHYTH